MVKDEMTDVTGRVLQPPSILYGGRVHAGLVGSTLWALGVGKPRVQQHVSPRGGAVPRGVDPNPGANLVLLHPEPGGGYVASRRAGLPGPFFFVGVVLINTPRPDLKNTVLRDGSSAGGELPSGAHTAAPSFNLVLGMLGRMHRNQSLGVCMLVPVDPPALISVSSKGS